MREYSWFLSAVVAVSVVCTVVVNPTGEGFVRGYNVVFTLVVTSVIVWGTSLPAIGFLVSRFIKTKDVKGLLRNERPTALLVVVALVVPLLNVLIVRIKSALESR